MAEKTITGLAINSILVGLLTLAMISSYMLLVNNEGRGEIFDEYPEVEDFNLNLSSTYTGGTLLETANINSNLSANYNPEIAISAADQSGNAISINLENIITVSWAAMMALGSLIFGNVFIAISSLLVAIIGFVAVAYFIKGIRTGQT